MSRLSLISSKYNGSKWLCISGFQECKKLWVIESFADDLHYIHQFFGEKAIIDGDINLAASELKKSLTDKFQYGVVSSFGPQSELASMLLVKGQKEAVITYLKTAIIVEKEEKTKTQIRCALKDIYEGKNPFKKLKSPNFWFKICGE